MLQKPKSRQKRHGKRGKKSHEKKQKHKERRERHRHRHGHSKEKKKHSKEKRHKHRHHEYYTTTMNPLTTTSRKHTTPKTTTTTEIFEEFPDVVNPSELFPDYGNREPIFYPAEDGKDVDLFDIYGEFVPSRFFYHHHN